MPRRGLVKPFMAYTRPRNIPLRTYPCKRLTSGSYRLSASVTIQRNCFVLSAMGRPSDSGYSTGSPAAGTTGADIVEPPLRATVPGYQGRLPGAIAPRIGALLLAEQ